MACKRSSVRFRLAPPLLYSHPARKALRDSAPPALRCGEMRGVYVQIGFMPPFSDGVSTPLM